MVPSWLSSPACAVGGVHVLTARPRFRSARHCPLHIVDILRAQGIHRIPFWRLGWSRPSRGRRLQGRSGRRVLQLARRVLRLRLRFRRVLPLRFIRRCRQACFVLRLRERRRWLFREIEWDSCYGAERLMRARPRQSGRMQCRSPWVFLPCSHCELNESADPSWTESSCVWCGMVCCGLYGPFQSKHAYISIRRATRRFVKLDLINVQMYMLQASYLM